MTGQMSIFDYLYPERFDPLKAVVKMARPYWTSSRDDLTRIFNTDPDIKAWSAAVKHEYCPYELSGHYGPEDKPNYINAYNLMTRGISIDYNDGTGERHEIKRSWADFAREIGDLILKGEY